MARIRTTKPEFYSDPDVGRLSLEARYLYKGTWSFADDAGRIPADPRFLKASVFPFDDKIGVRKVKNLLSELVDLGKVVEYEVDGISYLYLPTFRKHQRIDKPQAPRYPPPPFPDDSENVPGTVQEHSPPYPIRSEGIRFDPGKDEVFAEKEPQREIVARLAKLCAHKNRAAVMAEAVGIVDHSRRHVDELVIEEALTFAETKFKTPPELPRAVFSTIQSFAKRRGVVLPDLPEKVTA